MPQNKYQQVHTEDTDTESSSHSRNSSNGGMNSAGNIVPAVVPASNLPTTYSSQHLISGSSEDVGEKECVATPRQSVNNQNDATTFQVSKKHLFTVVVLCFINLINYMDRFTIAGVLADLQKDFNINDGYAGLLQTAFIISYMIFAPIFGYLGDRYSRRLIMGFGIALWSATTLFGSFMPNYTWFVIFRAMVGIGEASYSTIAPTIISDLFVKNQRSKYLALFYFAIPVGSGLGYIIGSETANALNNWRWALRVTPALGALAVILLYFCSEPERGEAEGSHHMEATSYTEDLRALVKNPSFMLSTGGFTCVAFVAGALAWWGPTYMYLGLKTQVGNENLNLNDVSYQFGIVAMFAGLIGVPLGSFMAQKYRPVMPNCDPLICALGLFISSPMVFFGMILADVSLGWTLFFVFLAEVSLNLTWSLVADILLVRNVWYKMGMTGVVSFVFGVITMASGIVGVPLGSYLSQALIKRYPRCDPIICAMGLIISAPLMAGAMILVTANTTVTYLLIFFAELSLNLNWAIVADILLYVVIPTRRSTAEAFQILISHTFGDAGSPYLVGVISDAIKIALRTVPAGLAIGLQSYSQVADESFVKEVTTVASNVYDDNDTDMVKFKSLQYSLFTTCFVEILGAIFFLLTAGYILKDKAKAERAVQESQITESTESTSQSLDNSTIYNPDS